MRDRYNASQSKIRLRTCFTLDQWSRELISVYGGPWVQALADFAFFGAIPVVFSLVEEVFLRPGRTCNRLYTSICLLYLLPLLRERDPRTATKLTNNARLHPHACALSKSILEQEEASAAAVDPLVLRPRRSVFPHLRLLLSLRLGRITAKVRCFQFRFTRCRR